MKWSMALVGAGYLFLMVTYGWLGLAAAALHVGLLLLFVKR